MASLENAAAVWCAIALRITIGISLGSIVLALILRAVPRTSPDLRHRLWGLVILQGLCWFRIPIGLPWLNGELPGKAVATNQLTEAASISFLRSPSDIPHEELPASSDSWGSDSVSSSPAPSIRSHFVTAGLVMQVLAVAWMCVVVVLLSLLALRFRRFRRELIADVRPVSSALVADLNGLSWQHGIGRPVRLAESRVCCVPMLVGVMRPTILLPSATLDLPRAELQTLLAHELGHLKKHHWVFTGLSLISCVLNFFNPFVWWSRKRLIDAREESADRWVTESGGQSPTAYARALVAVAQMLSRPQAVWIGAAQSPSHLRRRVEAILDVSRARARSSAWTGVVLTVVLAATVLLSPISFRPNQSVLGQNAPGKSKSADQDTAGQEQVEALPPGVLRVFGSERLRTWGEAFSLALSQDGKTLAVGSPGGLMLVDWRSGKTLKVLPSTSQPTSVSFHPEGKLVATGDESGIVEIWDIVEGVMVRNIAADASAVWSVVFSPDGESLITGGIDGSIKFWEVATGKLQRQWQAHAASEARRSHGVALGVTQDGKHLVSGHGDGLVRVFETSSGAVLHSFEAHDPAHMGVGGVAISRDGTHIASCGLDGKLKIWETAPGRLMHDLQISKGLPGGFPFERAACVAFSPNGKILAVAHTWAETTTIELRDVETGQIQSNVFKHPARTWFGQHLAFSPDGNFLISTARDYTIRVWDLLKVQEVHEPPVHPSLVGHVAFSPDDRILATVPLPEYSQDPGPIRLWEVSSGRQLENLDVSLEPHDIVSQMTDLAFSPDGKLIAVGGLDVRVRDRATGQELTTLPGAHVVRFNFSPDSKLLALARGPRFDDPNERISVWSIAARREVFSAPQQDGKIRSVLTNDGRLLAAGFKQGLKAWDLNTGKEIYHLPDIGTLLDVSADGKVLAAHAKPNVKGPTHKIILYDGESGKETRSFDALDEDLVSLRFSRDSRLLAGADLAGNVVIWDLQTGAVRDKRRIGRGYHPVWSVAFSHSGRYLATANKNGTAYLLEIPEDIQRGR